MFSGADGKEEQYGPDTLITFDASENHSIRALNEDLVFLAFLHGAPGYQQVAKQESVVSPEVFPMAELLIEPAILVQLEAGYIT
jgi:hypothetical protein